MTDMQAAGKVRVCPKGGRRVPSAVSICRCGNDISAVEPTDAPPAVKPPTVKPAIIAQADVPAGGGSVVTPILKTLVAVIIAGGAAFGWWRIATLHEQQRSTSRFRAPAAASSPSAARPAAAVSTPAAAPNDQQRPAQTETPPASADAPTDAAARVAAAFAAGKAKSAADQAAAAQMATLAATPPDGSRPLEDVISGSMPAVVRLETSRAIGTGFFVPQDTILTNAHVVGNNSTVTVRRANGTTSSGRVDTTAPEIDVAIVRVSATPGQPVLPIGSASQSRAGQEVIALGSPLGLQNTVTRGIVSAVRQVGGLTLVQTDAAINPGNSGGPLLDRAGRVIAITTMSVRPDSGQGLSFAIGIEHASALLAGKRPTTTSSTPLSTLNDAMKNQRASESDAVRTQATRGYEQGLTQNSR